VDVVLVRAGALGDVLLLRPTIAALRRAGRRVGLLAPAPGAVLVGSGRSEVERAERWDGPAVAGLLSNGSSECGPGSSDEPGASLDSVLRRASVVIAYTRSLDVIQALRARVKRLLVHDPSPPPEGPHAAAWLSRPLSDLGLSPETGPPPELAFTDDEHAEAGALLTRLPPRFLAIHPGSGSPTKNWPAERFVTLARRLSRLPFLLVRGPAEQQAGDTDCVVARNLPLRVLGAVLARAGLFVGNDSGVSHLAAAAGAPTLALFGPTDPRLWSPVGRRVRWLRAPDARLSELTVESVEGAALELLSATSAAPTG